MRPDPGRPASNSEAPDTTTARKAFVVPDPAGSVVSAESGARSWAHPHAFVYANRYPDQCGDACGAVALRDSINVTRLDLRIHARAGSLDCPGRPTWLSRPTRSFRRAGCRRPMRQ